MKTNNKEQPAQNFKENTQSLKAIELLIKVSAYRKVGHELLMKLDSNSLSPKQKVQYLYLNGRYFLYCFKLDNDLEKLENSNDFFDDMFKQAYEHKVKITDPRLFYSRAFVKFQLSKLVWDQERKPWLLEKARTITNRALSLDNQNDSFLWLQKQLQT
ncbi:hypothetical protein KCTC32516_00545 [Polaribacter huanghezhanensis]|uniref:hypothetical protein n=1 Tax=Polaribacter huanghezhanensis TaxID=1354726 RepID=UPI0026476518|nr:hypothetical protein [Polaribacter huanghezhanensis]WKD85205.1 hypothetical protein KCTC32516_00545 [Polaribacter huanghezhanensis]